MKIDINKQYKTRDGQDVKIYTTEHEGNYPVVGAVEGVLTSWTDSGEYTLTVERHDLDLIEVKPEQVVWVVHYEEGFYRSFQMVEDASKAVKDFGGTIYRVTLTDDMVVE